MSSLAAAAMALPPIDKKANSFASNSKKGEWVSRQNQNKHLKNGVSRNHNQNNGYNNNRRKARKQKQDQSMEQVVVSNEAFVMKIIIDMFLADCSPIPFRVRVDKRKGKNKDYNDDFRYQGDTDDPLFKY